MPAKKNKGKGNKLAKMSEEERLRYLQHRAEIELEAKRRKQQLIAAFTKNKLKREEAFSRLNTAKINEQWRFQLRVIKCKELYDEVEYLWRNFDQTLRIKNAIIKTLYEELEIADINHRRLEEVHIVMIDKLIESHNRSLEILHENYVKSVMIIKTDEIMEMNQAESELKDSCRHMDIVLYAQNNFIYNKLMITKTRNAVNTYNIEYTKVEAIAEIKKKVGTKITELWSNFNKIIVNYSDDTQEKWEHYEYLKKLDEEHKRETTNFPHLQSILISTIETLRNQQNNLTIERKKTITELKNELEELKLQIFKLKEKININQTIDKIQLKRLSVVSNKIIEDLKIIAVKSNAMKLMTNICLSLEPLVITANKYFIESPADNVSVENDNVDEDEDNCDINPIVSPYKKLEKFWKQFNYVKAENFIRMKQYMQLVAENKKLKNALRSYFRSVTRGSTAKSLE